MDDRKRKIAVAGGVLGLGLAAAVLFRSPPSEPSVQETAPAPQQIFQQPAVPPIFVPPATALALGVSTPLAPSEPAEVAATPQAAQVAPWAEAEIEAPPPLPVAFAAPPVTADAPPAPRPEQTHRIVDGDTLTKLAARYLGHADRYLEIFEANRDILATPDMLPIGGKLRIPSRERRVPRPGVADEALVPVPPRAAHPASIFKPRPHLRPSR